MVSPSKKRQIKGRVTTGHKIDRKGNYVTGQWCKWRERKGYMMAVVVIAADQASQHPPRSPSLSLSYSALWSIHPYVRLNVKVFSRVFIRCCSLFAVRGKVSCFVFLRPSPIPSLGSGYGWVVVALHLPTFSSQTIVWYNCNPSHFCSSIHRVV